MSSPILHHERVGRICAPTQTHPLTKIKWLRTLECYSYRPFQSHNKLYECFSTIWDPQSMLNTWKWHTEYYHTSVFIFFFFKQLTSKLGQVLAAVLSQNISSVCMILDEQNMVEFCSYKSLLHVAPKPLNISIFCLRNRASDTHTDQLLSTVTLAAHACWGLVRKKMTSDNHIHLISVALLYQ